MSPNNAKIGSQKFDVVLIRTISVGTYLCQSGLKVWDDPPIVNDVYIDALMQILTRTRGVIQGVIYSGVSHSMELGSNVSAL